MSKKLPFESYYKLNPTKNPLKTDFLRIYYHSLCLMCLDCKIYFLFEKQAFNGLLKISGIQKLFCSQKAGVKCSY